MDPSASPPMPSAQELLEFNALLNSTDNLKMKMKRQLYSAMRNGASLDTLVTRVGMTLGQISLFLVLRDKA